MLRGDDAEVWNDASPAPFHAVAVATVSSSSARKAICRAVALPYASAGRLLVLHQLPSAAAALGLRILAAWEAEALLDADARDARRALELRGEDGVGVQPILLGEHDHRALLEAAESERCELVVLARRSGTLEGWILDGIVRRAHVPVLLVGARGDAPYRHAAVAIDFSDASRAALLALMRIAHRSLERIDLVHAFGMPLDLLSIDLRQAGPAPAAAHRTREEAVARNTMEAFLDGLPAGVRRRCTPRFHFGDPAAVLLHRLLVDPPDVLGLGVHGRSRLVELLLGRIVHTLSRFTSVDFLTAHG